ncbi:MAG: hypothetical protein ACYCU0_15730 [Solirubrobacteraceae bacterium]
MTDGADKDEGAPGGASTRECMPCGGRGVVISRLGGEEHEETCPWCGGAGKRQEGVDAQARWLHEQAERPAEAERPVEAERSAEAERPAEAEQSTDAERAEEPGESA